MIKKYLLIAIIILLASTNCFSGDPYLSGFDEIKQHVLMNMGWDISNSTLVGDSAFNMFIRMAVCEVSDYLRGDESSEIITSVADQNTYTLDSTIIGIWAVNMNWGDSTKALIHYPMDKWEELVSNKTLEGKSGYQARPTYYDYDQDNIYLYPTPVVNSDSIMVRHWKEVSGLGSLDSIPNVDMIYRTTIVRHVVWNIALARTDDRTASYEKAYNDALNKTKELLALRRLKFEYGDQK